MDNWNKEVILMCNPICYQNRICTCGHDEDNHVIAGIPPYKLTNCRKCSCKLFKDIRKSKN